MSRVQAKLVLKYANEHAAYIGAHPESTVICQTFRGLTGTSTSTHCHLTSSDGFLQLAYSALPCYRVQAGDSAERCTASEQTAVTL